MTEPPAAEPPASGSTTAPSGPLAPHPAIETAYLAPEAVLYDDRSTVVLHLNGSAAALWMLLDGTLDTDGVVMELAEIYETSAENIRHDVEAALASFAEQNLLAEGPASA